MTMGRVNSRPFALIARITAVSYTHLDVYKRQSVLRQLSLLLCLALLLGASAAAEPQVYTASGYGYGGELQVQVTIDQGAITDIVLGDNHETNVVIDRAFPVIRQRILEANSPVAVSYTHLDVYKRQIPKRGVPCFPISLGFSDVILP